MPTNENQTPRPLPAELPKEPWPLFQSWLDEAVGKEIQPHPTAMTLASVDLEGRPAARVVMCRGVDTKQGWLVFYTNQRSPKATELEANPRASLIFHWDPLRRQARIDGPVTHAPAADSDAYFASRPLDSQISAWASDQSEPIPSREALLEKVAAAEARFGVQHGAGAGVRIPRPSHWGGYRVWVERMELWVGLPGRNHDRGLWTRTLTPAGEAFTAGAWRVTRLQP
jgi:pyridoxamine 5'-phosphate oxidase